MKRAPKTAGYTVIELMIVLAVTGALLAMVITLISGQQGRTEFTQSINDIQAQINDIINNVSNGYYANNGNVQCTVSGGAPYPTKNSGTEGANTGCVFFGRAMQFSVGGDSSQFNIYDLVGLQYASGTNPPKNISEAKPLAIAPPNGDGKVDTTQSQQLLYGLQAATMRYTNAGVTKDVGAVAFTNSPASYSPTTGNLQSGALQVEVHPIYPSASVATGESKNSIVPKIIAANMVSADGGVTICFNSTTSNQSGTITIGSNGRQLATTLAINNGKCS